MTQHGEPRAHTHGGAHAQQDPNEDPITFWERRYAESDRIWSGKVNATLEAAVNVFTAATGFTPGRALDLGCGEGGDVLWLASQGWHATGVDLSLTAIARGREAVTSLGFTEAHFFAVDLGQWVADPAAHPELAGPYDLVTASFLQSPVELPRAQILRAAASVLAPGGRLVILAHAAPPPWAKDHPGEFLSPAGELLALDLDPGRFVVERAEVIERDAQGPDGHGHHLEDTIVVVRRAS